MAAIPRPFTILAGGTSVAGPSAGTSTDNAIVRWDGVTGRLIQNSTVTLSDTDGTFTQTTTNGSIVLVPNGTGGVKINHATNPQLILQQVGTSVANVQANSSSLYLDAAQTVVLRTGSFASPITALTLDASQNATFAGSITLAASKSIIGTGTSSLTIGQAGGNNLDALYLGSGAAGVVFNNASRIKSGSGSPEGAVTAAVGSLWLRTDGGASTSIYVKESGSGNSGWVAK